MKHSLFLILIPNYLNDGSVCGYIAGAGLELLAVYRLKDKQHTHTDTQMDCTISKQ